MIIVKNALSEETLSHIEKELDEFIPQNRWRSSQSVWNKNILYGITGSCLQSIVGDETKAMIQKDLGKHLPEHQELMAQYYIWEKNSGICMHDDEIYAFGATLYLNPTWHINYGGTFIWDDGDNDGWNLKAFSPIYNTLVITEKKQYHMVTPVSPLAPHNRYTIQMWGKPLT